MPLLLFIAASVFSAMLYVVAIAMFAALHRRVPEMSWVSDAVSNYEIGPAASYFRTYSHTSTVAAALLAIQFVLSESPEIPCLAMICMVLTPLFRIGATVVPTDMSGAPGSARGRLHLLFAIATFAASYTAIANSSLASASASPDWLSIILSCTYFAATFSLVGVVATMFPPLKWAFGLFERAFLLSTMLWFLAGNILFLVVGNPV